MEALQTRRPFKMKTQMKKKISSRKALLVIAGALFFPLLCIECWWINLIAIALLGTAALLNPDYVG